MSKILYFLTVFAESSLSVLGIRGAYEQPVYRVMQQIAPDMEVREYAPCVAVETSMADGQSAAFQRLFRYITGANLQAADAAVAPARQSGQMVAMTVPVAMAPEPGVMRFFLPASVAKAGAPAPADPLVRVVQLPAATLAVVRYGGQADDAARALQAAALRRALAQSGWVASGGPLQFSYDPPFTPPFLRRNETALAVTRP